MSANKPDSDDGTKNIRVDVAGKAREILSSDGREDMSHKERLSKPGKIASEISGEAKGNETIRTDQNQQSIMFIRQAPEGFVRWGSNII